MDEMKKQMRELIDRLNQASDAYYNGQGELMSDYEWDALFDQLKQLETECDFVFEDSPTMNVSADDVAGQKEPHEYAALSLAKTKKTAELEKWSEGKPIWISWKLDGLTLVVTYDQGRLQKVVTRGDGHIGTNITHLSSAIQGILPSIPSQEHVVIRGEAVISYEDFEAFRIETGEDYANPRNLASGSLTLKDIEEVRRRKIHWIPFTLVHTDTEIVSWGERMAFLEKQGFTVVDHEEIKTPSLRLIEESIAGWTEKVTKQLNPYPVDGLVIVYEDTVYAEGGSVTGHHATRAGFAFKWQDEAAPSVLDHIEWSCAASTITPVAVFEPVEIEGTIVKRASLCNISECERLGIGDAGTQIDVIKANKIIPKIIRVREKHGELMIPERCPVCGSLTSVKVSENSGTRTLKCTNPGCTAKKLKKFTRFVSKAGMDIDGISEATLSRFINAGWIRNYGDIYRLSMHRGEITQLDGFGEKSAENLMNSIEKARSVTDQKLLYALNIPLIGQDVAKRLLGAYPLRELLTKAESSEDPSVFADIDGIGSEKSGAFVRWIQEKENQENLDDLLQEVSIEQREIQPEGNRMQGLSFVVTGDVHHFANRNDLKAYIEAQGGRVTGSVSKSTAYLINNDPESTSSKNRKAKQLGIEIISEDEFLKKFG